MRGQSAARRAQEKTAQRSEGNPRRCAAVTCGLSEDREAEVHDGSHDEDERDVDFDGKAQELAVAALDADGADGDGDALRRDHLACAGACRVGGGEP